MPRVPTYDSFQVTPGALPSSRQTTIASPELFDAGAKQAVTTGENLLKAGGDLNDVAVKMQERENADRIFRSKTAVDNDYIPFITSIRERRGRNAIGATREAAKWWDDQISKQSAALENDVQRGIFQQKMAKLRTQSLANISAYESDQRRQSLVDSTQASIVGSINVAAASPNDPATLASAKSDIEKETQALAQINGWSSELYAAKKSEYMTNLHKQVFQSMIDTDPAGARAYYEANKDEIAGSARDVFEKQIATSTRRRTVQSFGDAVIGDNMSETDALALAHKQFSGEDEDAAVREVRSRFADIRTARDQDQREANDQGWHIYAQTGKVDAIPASVLTRMDGRSVIALRNEAERQALGKQVQTDPGVYYDLSQKAANDPQGFEQLDLRNYFDKLAPAQRRHFMDMQQKLKEPAEVDSIATLTQQLDAMHNELGWDAANRADKGKFDAAVYSAIDAEQSRLGRKLNYDETQKIIHRMAVSGEVMSGHWYTPNDDKHFYQVAGTPAAAQFKPDKLTIDDIPAGKKFQITDALRRHNVPVTNDAIVDLYLRGLGFTNAK